MIRGAVSNNDLELKWCQWLLQVQFTSVFEKILKVFYFIPREMERVPLLARKTSWRLTNVIFDGVGLPWVSH